MRGLLLLASLLLAGCVSTEMRRYVGSDISEVMIAYGQPAQIIELPDGRRAYQFRSETATLVTPGRASSTVTAYGNVATVQTVATPATAVPIGGCLLTFIAAPSGNSWTVTEIRVPRQLVC